LSLALTEGRKLGIIYLASAEKYTIVAKANTILISFTPTKAKGK
jgi:hypothetical protein